MLTALALALAVPAHAVEPADAAPAEVSVRGGESVKVRSHQRRKPGAVSARHSVTLAPFRAAWPALHARYELRLNPRWGLDVAAGTGTYSPTAAKVAGAVLAVNIPDLSITELEAATSAYVGGRFARGVQLGLTVRRQVATGTVSTGSDSGVGTFSDVRVAATTIGPHVGIKRVAKSGLTFQARVGGGWMFADATAATVATIGELGVPLPLAYAYSGPMVFGNAGIGWSF